MAKSDNLLLKASSGSMGKLMTITRKRSGTMLLGKHRGKNTVAPTEKQLEVQRNWKMAINYGKAVMQLLDLKAEYKAAAKGDQSAFNVAVRDARIAPEITDIDVELYTGAIGSTISVRALDDFRVASVRVSIYNAAHVLLEQGDAVLHENGLDWFYTATVANDEVQGTVVRASARDLPRNETVRELVIA